MTTLNFDIPTIASRISSTATYQARMMVSKQGKHCADCLRILNPRSFNQGSGTCRQCEKAAQKVMPSCHSMLLRKW